MSPETLRAQIESEIGKDWDRTNLHGVDLRACLLQRPVIKTYENSFFDPKRAVADHNTPTVEMWQVLKEDPQTEQGYSIVYDHQAGRFGLATGGVFIGLYGGFLDALNAM